MDILKRNLKNALMPSIEYDRNAPVLKKKSSDRLNNKSLATIEHLLTPSVPVLKRKNSSSIRTYSRNTHRPIVSHLCVTSLSNVSSDDTLNALLIDGPDSK